MKPERSNGRLLRLLLGLAFVVPALLGGCSADRPGTGGPVDISDRFSSMRVAADDALDAEAYLDDAQAAAFGHPPDRTGMLGRGQLAWYRARLPAETLGDEAWVLEIPYALFAYVDIWFRTGQGVIRHQSGLSRPHGVRTEPVPTTAAPVGRGPDGDALVLVRIASGAPLLFSARLWTRSAWEAHKTALTAWYGMFFGAIGVLLVYNLALALALRDTSYLYYGFYLSFLALVVFDISGLQAQYTTLGDLSLGYLSLAAVFAIAFSNRFLDTRSRFPVMRRVSILLSVVILTLAVPIFFPVGLIPPGLNLLAILATTGLATVYYFLIPIYAYAKGVFQARFLILAFAVIFLSFFWYIAHLFGHGDIGIPTQHIVETGFLIEALLLSLALADRINLLSQAKEAAELDARRGQQHFSKQIIRIQEEERQRFSDTLHDAIGHELLVLRRNIELSRSKPEGGLDAAPGRMLDQCDEIIRSVRNLSHELHPHTLRRLGLRSAIESMVENALDPAAIEWVTDIVFDERRLGEETRVAVYRIIQEAVSNILKHAQAREVIVRVHEEGQELAGVVKDDGRGFPVNLRTESGIGLNTMRGRARLLGGSVSFDSSPERGTRVAFRFPIGPSANE